MRRGWALLVLLVLSIQAQAEWRSRTYGGGFSTHWSTRGRHGHDQELCAGGGPYRREFEGGKAILIGYVPCDDDDFARANLDDSFGSQIGFERVRPLGAGVSLVTAVESSVSHTEFNLSQRDFAIVSASAAAGLEAGWKGVNAGIRYGAGPSWYDGKFSTRQFTEGSLTVPLSRGLGVRLGRRQSDVTDRKESAYGAGSPRIAAVRETSVLLVASHGELSGREWELATSTGLTQPGTLGGRQLSLGPAAVQQFAISRRLSESSPTVLHLLWNVSEHESLRESEFLGYGGNFRGKTINSLGIALTRTRSLFPRVSVSWGGGVEAGSWSDDHRLLVDDRGEEVLIGLDGALTARGSLRLDLGRGMALETGVEHVRWTMSGIGETRTMIGLVLGR